MSYVCMFGNNKSCDFTNLTNFTDECNGILGKGSFGNVYKKCIYNHISKQTKLYVEKTGDLTGEYRLLRHFKNTTCDEKEGECGFPEMYYKGDNVMINQSIHEGGEHLPILMNRYDGSLDDLIKNNDITPVIKTQIINQLIDKLTKIHKKGVYHRDIKPANICYKKKNNDTYEVFFIDFGLCLTQTELNNSEITIHIVGTPFYMHPFDYFGIDDLNIYKTRYNQSEIDTSIINALINRDIFALFATCYELEFGNKFVNLFIATTTSIHDDIMSLGNIYKNVNANKYNKTNKFIIDHKTTILLPENTNFQQILDFFNTYENNFENCFTNPNQNDNIQKLEKSNTTKQNLYYCKGYDEGVLTSTPQQIQNTKCSILPPLTGGSKKTIVVLNKKSYVRTVISEERYNKYKNNKKCKFIVKKYMTNNQHIYYKYNLNET
jgi:serine/threonine protein kinase